MCSDKCIVENPDQIQLDIPVLFLIYNRPDTAQEVFNAIRKVKPKKLYVASDGPRPGNIDDITLCQKSREILKQIDWNCELHTRFLDENLGGCDSAVRSEITWFFKNEEMGIILEDDIVPNVDFFLFCEKLLRIHKCNQSVMMIGGYNPVSSRQHFNNEDYYSSRWATIWGWATWRDRWEKLDITFTNSKEFIKSWYRDKYFNLSREFQILFGHQYEYYSQHPTKSPWDLQWCYTLEKHNGVCLIPRVNLITNIGQYGYHSNDVDKKSPFLYLPTEHLDVSTLDAPMSLLPNKELDAVRFNHYASASGNINYMYLKFLSWCRLFGLDSYRLSEIISSLLHHRK